LLNLITTYSDKRSIIVKERELEYQLNDSDSKLVITLTLLIPRMQKIKSNTNVEKIIGCHINSYLPFPKKQLFPLELDDVLMAHPKILEACTIGVPDEYRGETVKAFIVVKESETLTEEEVTQYC
jgi:acyl-coenzyme A synthetase/AMP-(fatty) acid ligase